MWLPFNTSIWFYRQPIDFRKQIDGIVMLIADTLKKNPTSGQLFVFRNKSADKVKLLYWDDNGFWLLYKRFEQGKFQFPVVENQSISLSKQQLQSLLSGLNWSDIKPHKTANYRHFF